MSRESYPRCVLHDFAVPWATCTCDLAENAEGQAQEPWTHGEIVDLQAELRGVDYPEDLLEGRRG